MSLRLRMLVLHVQTSEGLYGARVPFGDGLVLLRANNNMGKSTCVQAIIYALGLERMLGPSSSIPLPHVMTKYVEDGNRELAVLESEVLLQVENEKGDSLTVRRSVVGDRDHRLVSTWDGPQLTAPSPEYSQRDYFVRDPGAAQNEAGFYRKLADFIGWDIPTVRRFNGSECPLYLEAIFPLFIVEQKHGWSGIQSNLPTYLGIREMAKRSIEFVLNLDAANLVEERQQIEQLEIDLKTRWRNVRQVASSAFQRASGRIVGLPDAPSAQWPMSASPSVEVFRNGRWLSIQETLSIVRTELGTVEATPIATSDDAAAQATRDLEAIRAILADRESVAGELLSDLQREQFQLRATGTRLDALRDDLRRNKDALKLRNFGSVAGWSTVRNTCPTCQQNLADTLLSQNHDEHPMSVEDNIEFIERQIKTFEHLRQNSNKLIERKSAELSSFQVEIENLRGRTRALRQTLVSPSSAPSIDAVRQRIDLEMSVRTLEKLSTEFDDTIVRLGEIAEAWKSTLARKSALPSDGFTLTDKKKLDRLRDLLREQLREFGFSSLQPDTIEISKDTYRPTREGFDLGFDLSASDNIRTIWAYLQGLLELSSEFSMNHLGLLVFDEPRQQEAAEWSFEGLLRRAASSRQRGQQMIFATSEPLENLERMTQGLNPTVVSFEGRVIVKQL